MTLSFTIDMISHIYQKIDNNFKGTVNILTITEKLGLHLQYHTKTSDISGLCNMPSIKGCLGLLIYN